MTLVRLHAIRKSSATLAAVSLLALGAALSTATPARAAPPQASADSVYRSEVARCRNAPEVTDRHSCMREAGAARAEARRNRLHDSSTDYHRNRMMRCDRLPGEHRNDCMRQMEDNGQTRMHGSVHGGGIWRETEVPVPAHGMAR